MKYDWDTKAEEEVSEILYIYVLGEVLSALLQEFPECT